MGSDELGCVMMDPEILAGQTTRFAGAVRDCFRDMLGLEIVLDTLDPCRGTFSPRHRLVSMIHFTGAVQGDFVLDMDESTAAGLIGAWSEGMTESDLRPLRPEFGGLLKEVLNTAVGKAIPILEEKFGRLTYHPPVIVYGELDSPEFPSSTLTLPCGVGDIDCSFVLDMAGSDASGLLSQAMVDLHRAREEMSICCKVLEDLIDGSRRNLVSPGLVAEAERVLAETRTMLAMA